MRNEPAHLGRISLDFARIPPRRDKKFPYEHTQVGKPGKNIFPIGSFFLIENTALHAVP